MSKINIKIPVSIYSKLYRDNKYIGTYKELSFINKSIENDLRRVNYINNLDKRFNSISDIKNRLKNVDPIFNKINVGYILTYRKDYNNFRYKLT